MTVVQFVGLGGAGDKLSVTLGVSCGDIVGNHVQILWGCCGEVVDNSATPPPSKNHCAPARIPTPFNIPPIPTNLGILPHAR